MIEVTEDTMRVMSQTSRVMSLTTSVTSQKILGVTSHVTIVISYAKLD